MIDEKQRILDSTHGRFAYVLSLFLIFIVLNPLLNFVFSLIGWSPETVISISGNKGEHEVVGVTFDLLAYWYFKLPLFIYVTHSRVVNTGLNKWLTIVFLLPIINSVLWFWPPMKITPNRVAEGL